MPELIKNALLNFITILRDRHYYYFNFIDKEMGTSEVK